MNTFKLGDQVQWSSQAGGHYTTKIGTVVEVVPSGVRPQIKTRGSGPMPRSHKSYIVNAAKEGQGRSDHYWPLVKNLSLKKEQPTEPAPTEGVVP